MTTNRTDTRLRFHVPKPVHDALRVIAAARGESLSQTIRRAVDQYVAEAKRPIPAGQGMPPTDHAA